MKIAILEAGEPPPPLVKKFGSYDTMTRGFLGPAHCYETFRVFAGDLPESTAAFDACAITGSADGVHNGLPWVDRLCDFVRSARDTKLVGICFGHQVIAHALGGTVVRAPQGWGVGLHRYDVVAHDPWMDDADSVAIAASHQDQVATPPPKAHVLAASPFTPYAILSYTDRPAISFQFHPEFAPDFSRALLTERRPAGLADAAFDAAIASYAAPNDNARLARWVAGFLAMR